MTTYTLAQYLSELTLSLTKYYLTPIYIIAMIGNIFNILIFSRRMLRSNSCSKYFIGMSIGQIFVLNTFGITRIITYIVGYDIAQTTLSLCKIRIFTYILSLGLMRQFLCLISLDRWIVSTKHERIRKLSSSIYIRWLIVGSVLFWLLFSIHGLIGYEITPRGCGAPIGSTYAYFYALQITISSIIPFFVIALFSILTLYNIRSSARVHVSQASHSAITTVPTTQISVNYRRRERQLIKLSLLQVLAYVLLSMIATIAPLYSFLTSTLPKSTDQLAIDRFIVTSALILLYTYTAVRVSFINLINYLFLFLKTF